MSRYSPRDSTFVVTLTQSDADALFALQDMDAALGIDRDFDSAHDYVFGPSFIGRWNAIMAAVLKVSDAREHEDPHVWTMFCLQ